MAFTDWEFSGTIITGSDGRAALYGGYEGYVGGYSGTGSISPPSGAGTIGDQFRVYSHNIWRAGSISTAAKLYTRTDTFISSAANENLTQVVSSSAYSIRTWIRIDKVNSNLSIDLNNVTTFAGGIVFKAEDSSENLNKAIDDNSVDCGYRLMFTTDTITNTNRGDRRLNLKLCGANWFGGGAVLCSGSTAGNVFDFQNWYRLRMDVFEKSDTVNGKRDDIFAYLYDNSNSSWELVGSASYHQNSGDYIKWKNEPGFTGGERAGIVSGLICQSNSMPSGVSIPTTENSLLMNAYFDAVEIYAIPWDRNAT